MTRGDEAVRQVEIGLGTAPFQFVDLAAPVTLEVMMMFLARHFVTWRGAGDLNHANPTVFEQRIDVPVDGGDSESPVALSGTAMDFLGGEGAIRIRKCLANGFLLFRVSHATSVPRSAEFVTNHPGRRGLRRNYKPP